MAKLSKLGKQTVEIVNAFICGVINEVVEMIAGCVELIGLIYSSDDRANKQLVKESIENAVQTIRQNPNAIVTAIENKIEELKERYANRYSSEKLSTDIAYSLGEDVVEIAMFAAILKDIVTVLRKLPELAEFTKSAEKTLQKEAIREVEAADKGMDYILKKLFPKEPSKATRIKNDFGIDLFQKKGEETIQVWYKEQKIFEGEEKATKEYLEVLDSKSTPNRKKFLEEECEKVKAKKFPFKDFATRFDEHIERGHIKIKKKDAQTGEIAEEYEYSTGNGGKDKSEFQPPWQVKKEVSGVHTYKNIDGKILQIKEVKATNKLPTGETVETVEIEFYVKELEKWVKKKDDSTMWPKDWDMEKIKAVTKEASENVIKRDRSKFVGMTKEMIEVEFFSTQDGIIDNAYINVEKLK